MSDQFVAEIRIVGFNFAPTSWALCDGQLMPISQNTALFSLLGTNYGGDGRSTFGLPNFQGVSPMHYDQGPGLSNHVIGESGGVQNVTLIQNEIPAHAHGINGIASGGTQVTASGGIFASSGATRGKQLYHTNSASSPDTVMSPLALGPAGGSQPHNNMQPYLVLNFVIALQGIYPSRS